MIFLSQLTNKKYSELIIDPHYLIKHGDTVTDQIIIRLVKMLDGKEFKPDKIDKNGFEYYVEDKMKLLDKKYKLVWLSKQNEIFIGVINCYRRD